MVGFDDDTVALTDADGKTVGVERFNGDEVGRDNLEHVIVDGEVVVEVCAAVDDANQVLLTGLEGSLVVAAGV